MLSSSMTCCASASSRSTSARMARATEDSAWLAMARRVSLSLLISSVKWVMGKKELRGQSPELRARRSPTLRKMGAFVFIVLALGSYRSALDFARSAETARDIRFRLRIGRVHEEIAGRAELHQPPQVEERGMVGRAGKEIG